MDQSRRELDHTADPYVADTLTRKVRVGEPSTWNVAVLTMRVRGLSHRDDQRSMRILQ